MPITFSKDVNGVPDASVDSEALRERYVAHGARVAQHLRADPDVVAAWLSGPLVPPRTAPAADLHMAVLVHNRSAISYEHHPAPFSGVGRRLQIAFFPYDYFRTILDRGITCWVDIFDLHKLDDIEILYERDSVVSSLRRRMSDIKPSRLFVGRRIESLKTDCQSLMQTMRSGRDDDGALLARKILMDATRLLIVIAGNRTFSKTSHLYPIAQSLLSPAMMNLAERLLAVEDVGREEAARVIERTAALSELLFKGRITCADASN